MSGFHLTNISTTSEEALNPVLTDGINTCNSYKTNIVSSIFLAGQMKRIKKWHDMTWHEESKWPWERNYTKWNEPCPSFTYQVKGELPRWGSGNVNTCVHALGIQVALLGHLPPSPDCLSWVKGLNGWREDQRKMEWWGLNGEQLKWDGRSPNGNEGKQGRDSRSPAAPKASATWSAPVERE